VLLFESHLQGLPPDWEDFLGILVLLLVNSTISFIEENNAGNAAAALMAHLAPKTKVCASVVASSFHLPKPEDFFWSNLKMVNEEKQGKMRALFE
jgi:hypothetical protein